MADVLPAPAASSQTQIANDVAPAEPAGASRLEQSASRLAALPIQERPGRPAEHLLRRLPEQERLLQTAYRRLSQGLDEELAYSQAGEWLLDNFYIVRQAIAQIEEDLPRRYYRELPKLDSGSAYHSYPRVFAIGREITLLERCQIDIGRVEQYARVFQETAPLTMGEVWALPTMLRVALLEALTQAMGRLMGLLTDGEALDAALNFPFADGRADIVANAISSLRLMAAHDWKKFFEDVSLADAALRQDPAGLYAGLEFKTRDHCRKVVEELAAATPAGELEVALAAVRLAGSAHALDLKADPWAGLELARERHVGFYLLDAGRAELERQVGYRPGLGQQLRRWAAAQAAGLYAGAIIGLTLLIVAAVVA
ncbi:MAG: hypothetical protein ACRDHL_10050, partial [Candidatus Promineifilaceae bacterium]